MVIKITNLSSSVHTLHEYKNNWSFFCISFKCMIFFLNYNSIESHILKNFEILSKLPEINMLWYFLVFNESNAFWHKYWKYWKLWCLLGVIKATAWQIGRKRQKMFFEQIKDWVIYEHSNFKYTCSCWQFTYL